MMKRFFNLMLNPWAILVAIIAGGLIGWYNKPIASRLVPFGELYISLLQMCVLPILITAIISSLSRLISSGVTKKIINHLIVTIVSGLVLASATGLLVGKVGKPGAGLSKSAQATLGRMISDSETASSQSDGRERTRQRWVFFFDEMIPDNIFAALSRDEKLSVLFFSIIVGITLGTVGPKTGQPAVAVLEAFYETFIKIIGCLMYALPLGLLCLSAGQISQLGLEILESMLKLVLFVYIGAFVLMALYSGAICLWGRSGFFRSIGALREALVVAVATSSSFAAIPSALRGLKKGLKIDKDISDLVMPLGITLNPPGSVFHFAIATLFMADLYGVTLGISQYFFILIGAILAGIAASGAPGVAALSMITIILNPLGLPIGVAVILLAAIDPIVDPVLTLINVHANCATTVIVAKNDSQS